MASSDEESAGVPEWVVTYGDMMSLLLTFFIMLVSLSEINSDKGSFRSMMDAYKQRFGATSGYYGVPGKSLQESSAFTDHASQGMRAEGGTKKSSPESQGWAGPNKTVERINHGTVVTMGGPVFFDRFDATLTDDLKAGLDVLAGVVAKKPNRLVVRGHSSSEPLPPDSRFRDHMDLSFARAHSVAQYLVKRGISRDRLLVCAAGDSEPRILSRDPEDQRQNRRVDVFLIDSYISRPRTPDSAPSGR